MEVHLSLEEVFGKNPRIVARILRLRGINPARPYRARVYFSGVTIEQDDPPLH